MRNTHIYFIKPVGLDGPIKIGCSVKPKERLEFLSMWSPFPLEIVAYVPGRFPDECFLHQCFAHDHIRHEWFRSSKELHEAIWAIVASGTVDTVRKTLKPTGVIKRGQKPQEFRGCGSYLNRITRALKRLYEANGNVYCAPSDVLAIMSRWRRNPRTGRDGIHPTEPEIARLDEYLADPAAHSDIFGPAPVQEQVA